MAPVFEIASCVPVREYAAVAPAPGLRPSVGRATAIAAAARWVREGLSPENPHANRDSAFTSFAQSVIGPGSGERGVGVADAELPAAPGPPNTVHLCQLATPAGVKQRQAVRLSWTSARAGDRAMPEPETLVQDRIVERRLRAENEGRPG